MTTAIRHLLSTASRAVRSACCNRIAGLCVLLTLSLGLSACATITEGSAQTMRIETEPAGARCELTRDGELVTRIPATPATVSLFKEKGELALTCNKPGNRNSIRRTANIIQS